MQTKIKSFVTCFLLTGGLACMSSLTYAQTAPADSSEDKPLWVEMMYNDSTANYFDAVEDFEEFWKDKDIPEEDNQQPSDNGGDDEGREFALEYKRFIYWKMINEPYVQADGSILSKEDRLKIWKHLRK